MSKMVAKNVFFLNDVRPIQGYNRNNNRAVSAA